ncbi:MAG: glycosyltransferase family 4 protein [Acidimicrobiales bacterium]
MTRRPHALLVVENAPVPHDRRVWNQARALRDAGHDVTIISPASEKLQATERREVLDGIDVYRFPMPFGGRRRADFVLEYGWAVLACHLLAIRVFLRRRFDLIHVANPPDLFFGLGWMFRPFGVAFVFDQHDLSPETFESKFERKAGAIGVVLRWLERRSYRAAQAVVVTNESYRARATGRGGVDDADVFTVRNSPDLDLFSPRRPQPELKRGHEHLVVFVGTMGHQDGVGVLLDAAAHVRIDKGRDDIGFVFVGTGDTWEELQERHAELGLGDGAWFTGFIPDDEMLDILASADIGAAPDLDLPLNNVSTMIKTMDYMAMGLPVVSFDLTESRVSAGDAAIYARDHSAAAFGDAIIELVDDPERRAEMARIGQERIAGPLSWKHSAENLLAAHDHARAALR